MRRLLLSLLLVTGFVHAADEPLQVYRFGGLNTVAGDFHLKPGEARQAHEVDFGRQLGCLMPRYGYDSVSAMAGMDSVVDIFGAYYSDGTQRLCLVADSDGVGYGNVYVTGTGSADLSAAERIWRYFSVQNKPSFAMLDDNIYIVNGSHKGIIYDGDNARAYPLPTPGEPLIVPLNDSGPLHGEYIYRISSDGGGWTAYGNGSAGYSDGIISSRISVKNGKVLLTGFQWPPNDSLDYPDRCQMRFIVQSAQEDTYWVEIDGDTVLYVSPPGDSAVGIRDNLVDSINAHAGMTTKVFTMKHGNQIFTAIPKAAYGCYSMTYAALGGAVFTATKDSVWQIYIHRTRGNPGRLDPSDSAGWIATINIDYNDTTLLETLTVIDSIADTITYTTKLYHPTFYGRDSTGTLTYRYGAPRYVSSTSGVTAGWGIFNAWPTKQGDTLGVAYACAFIDTATGIESDTGRSLFVFCDSGNHSPSYQKVALKLPRISQADSGIVLNLYRACIVSMGHDTSWTEGEYDMAVPGPRGSTEWQERKTWVYAFIADSVFVINYYLVAQLTVDDTLFVDSIPYDSVNLGRRYRKQTAPAMMTTIFSHGTRLFGTQKSGLYYSQFDTLQSWGALALTPINPDDGDMVTTAWPARGLIRVMKSYSNLNVYQDANLQWTRTEVSGYYGCIAGHSHTAGLGGHYYLSNEGVLREVEGMNLERTQQVSLLSGGLNNFEQYDIAELSQATGFYFDRKYMLCIGDTTYVWDDRAQAWSTWGLPFAGATLYGTEDEVRFLPGDTMYFIKPGESGLYRFATSDSDLTAPIEMSWKSGPLLAGPEQKRIHRIGRWINSADASGSVTLNLFDQEADTVGSMTFSSLTSRYLMKGFPVGLANLFEMEITSSSPGTAIEGFDLWYNVIGKKATE